MQTIIAYIIIGIAVGYTIYSVVKKLYVKNYDDDSDMKCGSSCSGCSIKNCKLKETIR